MAVSKTQNERPAIVALIDLANSLEVKTDVVERGIATLTEGLADEISDRESADALLTTTIENETNAREQADDIINATIGEGFSPQLPISRSLSATNQAISDLDSSLIDTNDTVLLLSQSVTSLNLQMSLINSHIRFGATEEITVPANSSYSSSFAYPNPFTSNSKSFVVIGFADDLLQGPLELTLIDSTYSGFSYSINNTDSDPATVTIGYLAVRVDF